MRATLEREKCMVNTVAVIFLLFFFLNKLVLNHQDYYMDSSGTIPREDKFVVPRKQSTRSV